MKVKPEDIAVYYYAEGGEVLLGACVRTSTGYSLYKPCDTNLSDWERLASSKNPIDFDKIIFGKATRKSTDSKTTITKSTKNNIEDVASREMTSKIKQKGKETLSKDNKKVKKSFL